MTRIQTNSYLPSSLNSLVHFLSLSQLLGALSLSLSFSQLLGALSLILSTPWCTLFHSLWYLKPPLIMLQKDSMMLILERYFSLSITRFLSFSYRLYPAIYHSNWSDVSLYPIPSNSENHWFKRLHNIKHNVSPRYPPSSHVRSLFLILEPRMTINKSI